MTPAWILPDQVIIDALHTGLAAIDGAFNDGSIDVLLQRIFFNVKPEKRSGPLKTLLRTTKIEVIEQFPGEHQVFPCWGITLESAKQSQFVGDVAANGTGKFLGDPTLRGPMVGEAWTHAICITTYGDHPELVRWLSHLSTWLLAAQRVKLTELFDFQPPVMGLQDFQPYEHNGLHGGQLIYRRGLMVTAGCVQRDARLEAPVDITDFPTELPDTANYGFGQVQ